MKVEWKGFKANISLVAIPFSSIRFTRFSSTLCLQPCLRREWSNFGISWTHLNWLLTPPPPHAHDYSISSQLLIERTCDLFTVIIAKHFHMGFDIIVIQWSIRWYFIKGALDNILRFSFWLNFIYQVNIDC